MESKINIKEEKSLSQLMNFLTKNEKKVLLTLFFLAVVLRMVYVLVAYSKTGVNKWRDDFYYIGAAEQIAQGNWDVKHGDSKYLIVGPSLPILGAIFLKLFNNLIIPFFIYNILITSIMVPVLYYLGKELFSEKVGWVMAIWGIFFYEAYKYCPHILKESTLFLFIPLTLLFLIRSIKNISPVKNIIFAAVSFVWLIHTDERFFIYFPLCVLFFLLKRPFNSNPFIKSTGIWIIFVLILMIPWGIHNYKKFKQIVILTPRTTVFTSKFWGDNLAESASHFSDDEAKQKLIERWRENAIKFGNKQGLTPRQYGNFEARARAFINFWQPTYFRPVFIQYGFRPQKWSLAHNVAGLLFYGIYIPFYLAGFVVLIKKKHLVGLFLAFIPIIHSLLHAYMVWPLERYRSPITFIIVMIGTFTLFQIIPELNGFFFKRSEKS